MSTIFYKECSIPASPDQLENWFYGVRETIATGRLKLTSRNIGFGTSFRMPVKADTPNSREPFDTVLWDEEIKTPPPQPVDLATPGPKLVVTGHSHTRSRLNVPPGPQIRLDFQIVWLVMPQTVAPRFHVIGMLHLIFREVGGNLTQMQSECRIRRELDRADILSFMGEISGLFWNTYKVRCLQAEGEGPEATAQTAEMESLLERALEAQNSLVAWHGYALLGDNVDFSDERPDPLEPMECRPFIVHTTSKRFASWLSLNTRGGWSRDYRTETGFYVYKANYRLVGDQADSNPKGHFWVNGIHCLRDDRDKKDWKADDARWYGPIVGLIEFLLAPLDDNRIEVHATCASSALAPLFQELLEKIGAGYPESGLTITGATIEKEPIEASPHVGAVQQDKGKPTPHKAGARRVKANDWLQQELESHPEKTLPELEVEYIRRREENGKPLNSGADVRATMTSALHYRRKRRNRK